MRQIRRAANSTIYHPLTARPVTPDTRSDGARPERHGLQVRTPLKCFTFYFSFRPKMPFPAESAPCCSPAAWACSRRAGNLLQRLPALRYDKNIGGGGVGAAPWARYRRRKAGRAKYRRAAASKHPPGKKLAHQNIWYFLPLFRQGAMTLRASAFLPSRHRATAF